MIQEKQLWGTMDNPIWLPWYVLHLAVKNKNNIGKSWAEEEVLSYSLQCMVLFEPIALLLCPIK